MFKADPYLFSYRGVYGVWNEEGQLMYVGSSSLALKQLEENHRCARSISGYKMTHFRTMLESNPSWKFAWILSPRKCNQPMIEFCEQIVIQAMHPKHNIDKVPYKTSLNRRTYTDILEVYVG